MPRRLALRTKLSGLAAAALVVVAPACADLKENVVTGVTASYLDTAQGFDDLLRGAYSYTRQFYGQEAGFSLTEFGVDTFTKGSDGSYKYLNDYTTGLAPSDSNVTQMWRSFYQGINAANGVIGRADKITMDAKVKTRRVAEARFLRAFYYFHLVQMFGDVPLQLQEVTDATSQASRAPKADVYKAILDDLTFADANLDPTTTDYGRATKGAADHLLAKVYLTRAQAGDFDQAATYARKVIDGGQYTLLPRFADVFDIKNDRNKEVVWAIQFSSNLQTDGPGNSGHLYFLMEYDVLPGMQRTVDYGRPFKRFAPTKYLLGLYDKQKDSRYRDGFQVMWKANNAATIPKDASGKPKFAVGDTAVFVSSVELSASDIASRPYRVYTPSTYSYRIFPTLNKFLDPNRPSVTETRGSRDYLVFRLAETYLIAAEALLRAGKPADALPYFNAVRRRAAITGYESQMQVTADQLTLDAILDERARELAGESMRWFDLVRTGTLVQRVRTYNPDAAPNIKDYHALRPVPQAQIDRTSGTFPQNPGY